MTLADNERRIDAIDSALDSYVRIQFCDERMGRVMDAVDRAKEATQDLTESVREMRRENVSANRQTRATLISVLVAAGLALAGMLVTHLAGG